MATYDCEKIVKYVLGEMERRLVVNKPHLVHIIQHIENDISRSETNEFIKQMVVEKKIDEHLALSKREKPYSFYTLRTETNSFAKMISRLLETLRRKKELSVPDAARLIGYSPLIVRTLLTHLLLEGIVDYHGDLDSPVFYVPWDAK